MIRRETWIVLAIFVAALAGLLLWQRSGNSEAGDQSEPTETFEAPALVFDYEADALQTVRLERLGDRLVEFQRASGVWQIMEPEDLPGESTALESALGQLAFLTGEQMENVPAFSAMGLDQPDYRLRLILTDGTEMTAYVGNITPTSSGYYVLGSDQQVYVVDQFSLDPILGLIDEPPVQTPTAPVDVYPPPESTPEGVP